MSVLFFRILSVTYAALLLLAAACGRAESLQTDRRTSGSPQRIVSLGPSGTEILASLGALDRLVGRSRWDTWPETVRQVPDVGDAIRPSLERIIALRPDLVVLYAASDNAASIDGLQRTGINVVALRIDTIDDYLRAVDSLGVLVGARSRADSLTATIRRELDAVRQRARHTPALRVFIPVWDQPLMTIGGGSYLSELVRIAGGENVYGESPAPSLTVSFEDVVRRDPDVVLASPVSALRWRAEPGWKGLRAVREGRVLGFDTTLVSQPSSRLGAAAASLADLLAKVRR
ncbi:MAG: cobalamin-binding protein [Gemmatimonadaceae bacterium]|nr:cobalamin-binding protein [Gemmatimonadaceae bacterium]